MAPHLLTPDSDMGNPCKVQAYGVSPEIMYFFHVRYLGVPEDRGIGHGQPLVDNDMRGVSDVELMHLENAGTHGILHADLDELTVLSQSGRHGPYLRGYSDRVMTWMDTRNGQLRYVGSYVPTPRITSA